MTALQTVRRAQQIVGIAAVVRALLLGATAAFVVAALIGFASLVFPFTIGFFMPITALISGVVAIGILLWRSRRIVSLTQVALWIEQHMPQLEYALVTRVEQPCSELTNAMDTVVARQQVQRETIRALRRPLAIALAAFIASQAIEYVSPSGPMGHYGPDRSHATLTSTPLSGSTSRLDAIEARVTPPAYAGQRTTTLRDPSSVTALIGSGIVIRGTGSPIGITASTSHPVNVSGDNGKWLVSLAMPTQPTALRLTDQAFERVIVLAPQRDEIPKVILSSPAHDTALRTPRLVIQLNASATDDIGLKQGHFEYLITTGAGEIFKSRTINTPTVLLDGSRSATLRAILDLASLNLAEGDVVSMRAVVQDGNTLSGPGVGTSDTRTIRIVRASEYDSLAIDAAAPQPIDSSAMSQRMLIVMTEQLVRDQPKLSRQDLVKRSTDIGDMEERIRKRVHEILTETEEDIVTEQPGDSTPSIEEMEAPEEITGAKNPDLVTAYNALWQAVRSLKIAEPAPALPPMRVALKALDRARLANRLYLRGAPPGIIVDLKRVRLTGKEKGVSNNRSPRSFADSLRVRLSARFDAAIELIAQDPARASSELALLRVEAISSLPDFAAALGEASDAIRARRDATLPLLRARRALDGPPAATPLSSWSGGGEE